MADKGAILAILQGLPEEQGRRIHKALYERWMSDLKFGRAIPGDPAINFGGGFFSATTHATPDQMFMVPHSITRVPYLLIPMLPVNVVGAKLVELTTARAADTLNVYLSSPVASAPIYFYLEG
jgi:hypothetical protein